jgi:hypothetical protein
MNPMMMEWEKRERRNDDVPKKEGTMSNPTNSG